MSKVEIRLTNETDQPAANFEIYTESLKDGRYTESAPMRIVASGGTPIIQFPEEDERIIIVAKGNSRRMVFDKDQNANVRVETEAEIADRKRREELSMKSQADQSVRAAHAEVASVKEANAQAEHTASVNLKQAEGNAAKVQTTPATPAPSSAQRPISAGTPTQNKTPVDSKQVKNG